MAKNLNSATRLLRIVKKVASHGEKTQTAEAWAKIFGIDEPNTIRRAVAVGELLHAMHRELDLAREGLASRDFSKHLYESAFSKVENAISPMNLAHSWNNVRQYLTPEVITALEFCTEILPDEEAQISEQELAAIRAKIEELKDALSNTDTPPRLRALIQHHIELIERALKEYIVVGAKALREAGRTALGEIIEAKDEIAAAKANPAVGKLEATWKAVNSAADIALKAEKLAKLGQRAWDAISNFI